MCQSIGISDDSLLENVEEFEVNLSAENEPSAVVNPNRAIVKITDNDGMYNDTINNKYASVSSLHWENSIIQELFNSK